MTATTVLNLNDLCELLRRALEADGQASTAEAHLMLLKTCLVQKQLVHKVITLEGGLEVSDLCVLYPVYADWVTNIGVQLGFQCQDEQQAGEWAREMPNTLQVFITLRRLVMARLESMERAEVAKTGFGLLDVVERSVATGEPYEQSKARLHAKGVGLKPVK
ncbi:hypothetical protein [Pseudomonas sp. NPDC089569]|uniref:hypothetical protein n=1 Tax=Pseudomonas sp. NPDC089569 TaxID=3390722 RepID=UPI003CFD24DF